MLETISQTFGTIFALLKDFFAMFKPLLEFFKSTNIPQQIKEVDYKGLFTNGWFMIPYLAMICWHIYKKDINFIIVILLFSATWAFFGTPYMREILSHDQLQLGDVFPLLLGAVVVLGIIVYIFVFKSE
ncbi:MAG: hypothetical protein KJ950_04340 [Proteobacteria bacterium]|nr:hypothetical protein [Pseudomonadota bacterium]MBU1688495.1 hypothetical protein [Pseudomonadota bacterium]